MSGAVEAMSDRLCIGSNATITDVAPPAPCTSRWMCTSRRMCCPTHCARYCAPYQPLLRAMPSQATQRVSQICWKCRFCTERFSICTAKIDGPNHEYRGNKWADLRRHALAGPEQPTCPLRNVAKFANCGPQFLLEPSRC